MTTVALRDGLTAQECHCRCDGHAKTLAVILDTKGNIFGGFTLVEWESRTPFLWNKENDREKSVLFTLKGKTKKATISVETVVFDRPSFRGWSHESRNCEIVLLFGLIPIFANTELI
jgi:hypothetical protein